MGGDRGNGLELLIKIAKNETRSKRKASRAERRRIVCIQKLRCEKVITDENICVDMRGEERKRKRKEERETRDQRKKNKRERRRVVYNMRGNPFSFFLLLQRWDTRSLEPTAEVDKADDEASVVGALKRDPELRLIISWRWWWWWWWWGTRNLHRHTKGRRRQRRGNGNGSSIVPAHSRSLSRKMERTDR